MINSLASFRPSFSPTVPLLKTEIISKIGNYTDFAADSPNTGLMCALLLFLVREERQYIVHLRHLVGRTLSRLQYHKSFNHIQPAVDAEICVLEALLPDLWVRIVPCQPDPLGFVYGAQSVGSTLWHRRRREHMKAEARGSPGVAPLHTSLLTVCVSDTHRFLMPSRVLDVMLVLRQFYDEKFEPQFFCET